jgi:GNAT superfamily N-acetyltransferase
MTTIRPLNPVDDRADVANLMARAADYIDLETGLTPDEALVDEFFTDVGPGCDLSQSLKLGLFTGDRLDAIADVCFGYPDPGDAYLGLMLLAADQRGRGLGRQFLAHIVHAAQARDAPRLLLAALEANPRGRAFWEREGFRAVLTTPPAQMGIRTHVRIRMERPL